MTYELADHLGNVRALVRENVNTYTATMEDTEVESLENPRVTEGMYFQNLYATEVDDWRMNHKLLHRLRWKAPAVLLISTGMPVCKELMRAINP